MKRFKDFAKEQALDGDKIRLDDILDHEILVIAHQITGSKYSDNGKICLKLQFELQGEDISCSREVLCWQDRQRNTRMKCRSLQQSRK